MDTGIADEPKDLEDTEEPDPAAVTPSKGKGKAKADPSDLEGHTDEIWALALSPDGRLLASGGKDRRIGVWDVNEDKWVKGFSGHRDSISVSSLDVVAAAPI